MRPIRNSAKAIIIRDGQLLVITKRDQEVYCILPGGGQHPGETLHQTLARECLEEIGVQVMIGELLFIREYIGRNHEFATTDSDQHQIEFMFACQLPEDALPRTGAQPDEGQLSVAWVPIENLERARLYPAVLRTLLKGVIASGRPIYLGDVN